MIEQVYMSECIKHFHDGFRDVWGLRPYDNPNEPALFVGMYNTQDLATANNHKGRALTLFSGADISNSEYVETPIVCDEYQSKLINTTQDVKIVSQINYRSFDKFKPTPLGNKIYCYQNEDTNGNRSKYRYDLLEKVMQHHEIIIGYHPHTDEEMIEIYKECYLGLQLNPSAGYTSTKEMAHMGRETISNRPSPFTIPFEEDELLNTINTISRARVSYEHTSKVAREFINIGKDWLK
jgi:hypothetical protein